MPSIPRSVVLLALLAVAAWVGPGSARAADDDELVFGRVTDNPKADYGRMRPLLDYVVPRMADVGIRSGRILMARDNQQMVSYLRRGKVDWLTETPGSTATYRERAGARILLLSERGGTARYQAVMFARADSGIASLADLRGRSIAFQNNASTSAYFLPAAEILGAGLPLVVLASPSDRPSADVVGFVFARSELNISTWVHKGLVDAGAFSAQDWDDLEQMPEAFRGDLVIFHRTPFVPRAMEVVRGSLAPRVEARLREVLLAAADDPAAGPALQALWRTTRFRPLDAQAEADLAAFERGVARIRAEVE
jgi:phosphonate transport system substrate-binding protein